MPSLTIETDLLRRVLEAVTPAASPCLEDDPTSFMETVRIYQREDGATIILCTDGFRAHQVELAPFTSWKDASGDLVYGADFLKKVCADTTSAKLNLTSIENHTNWVSSVGGKTQRFNINAWPDMERLISDEVLGEEEVAFRLDYLRDTFDAFEIWHELGLEIAPDNGEGEEDVIPLRVHQMQKRKVNHFSMHNALGTLRVLLMPIVLKDSEWR